MPTAVVRTKEDSFFTPYYQRIVLRGRKRNARTGQKIDPILAKYAKKKVAKKMSSLDQVIYTS